MNMMGGLVKSDEGGGGKYFFVLWMDYAKAEGKRFQIDLN